MVIIKDLYGKHHAHFHFKISAILSVTCILACFGEELCIWKVLQKYIYMHVHQLMHIIYYTSYMLTELYRTSWLWICCSPPPYILLIVAIIQYSITPLYIGSSFTCNFTTTLRLTSDWAVHYSTDAEVILKFFPPWIARILSLFHPWYLRRSSF